MRCDCCGIQLMQVELQTGTNCYHCRKGNCEVCGSEPELEPGTISYDDHSELDQIAILRDELYERRSDLADILDAILSRKPWHPKDIEKRFVTARDPKTGKRYQYDTLTTEIECLDDHEPDRYYRLEDHEYTE